MISPPIESSAPAGIVIREPRDEPEPDPEPALSGIGFDFCRCFALSLGFPEASAGDLDEDLRRRVDLEDVGFSSEADKGTVGGVLDCLAVDWVASINCDWSCWSAMMPLMILILSPPQSELRKNFCLSGFSAMVWGGRKQ